MNEVAMKYYMAHALHQI